MQTRTCTITFALAACLVACGASGDHPGDLPLGDGTATRADAATADDSTATASDADAGTTSNDSAATGVGTDTATPDDVTTPDQTDIRRRTT